ncbi:MAG: hypothetical protein ABJ275_09755 [Maricaulaceae bacterium]
MLLLSVVVTPNAWADNIADCEALIAETVEDIETSGSALISSYRPAGAFLSSVYDDEDGHIEEIDGYKIRAVFCKRRSAIPTLRDFPILATGTALSLSQNFDSTLSDVTLTRFIDGEFKTTYSGPGLDPQEDVVLADVLDVFNLQQHELTSKEEPTLEGGGNKEDKTTTKSVVEDKDILKDEAIATQELGLDVKLIEEASGDVSKEIVELASREVIVEGEAIAEASKASQNANVSSTTHVSVPTKSEVAEFDARCRIVTRDAFGTINETPLSSAGLQNNLDTTPAFLMPLPTGLKIEAIKCERDTLTPGVNDYKVARAGYPFFYFVKVDDWAVQRSAALEFVGGKYRMNLLEGDFTDQELIDAKARILSFNANIDLSEGLTK